MVNVLKKLLFVIIVLGGPLSASADIDLRTATVQDINRAFEAGYAYEQATHHRSVPNTTPPLAGEGIGF